MIQGLLPVTANDRVQSRKGVVSVRAISAANEITTQILQMSAFSAPTFTRDGPMQIDFISDTVCPWCFIGKRRLARAMAHAAQHRLRRALAALSPGSHRAQGRHGPAGLSRRQVRQEWRHRGEPKLIAAEGAKDGIEFDFAAIRGAPNTLDSHRLIRWAEADRRAG